MTKTIKNLTLIALLAMLAACGGSDDPADAQGSTEADDLSDSTGTPADEVIVDTASDVVTSSADVNGFNIVTSVANPRAYDWTGTEVDIIAYVKDSSGNNPVEDGTVVTFVADDNGMITDQCATVSGACSVKWISSRDRNQPQDPPAGDDAGYVNDFQITIMARTIGQDSFEDENGNHLYDVGELYISQSEALLDANDNGDFDSGAGDYDEFFDFNSNGTFDLDSVYSKFRGPASSCTANARAAGHCAELLEVWDTLKLVNSHGGQPTIALYPTQDANGFCSGTEITDGSTINVATKTTYCVEISDINGNIPPSGTKISVSNDNGEIVIAPPTEVPNKFIAIGEGYNSRLVIQTDGTSSLDGYLTIEVEPVSGKGNTAYAFFRIQD